MHTGNSIHLNTKDLKPIQPSGFVPPSQRVHYSHILVQNFLFEAFGGLFPKLEMLEDGTAVYRHRNSNTDSFTSCVAAESINDIPQGEAMKLLQGWITLRKLVMEATVPEGVRSLLMNLKIPHPRVSPWFYHLRETLDGQKKLYILIGFEGPAVTLVSLEEGIAAIMNVPPSQLESLLATSMAPTGITNRVYVLDSDGKTDSDSKNTPQVSENKPAGKKIILMLALVAAVVLIVGSISTVALGMGMGKNEDKSLTQHEQKATKPMQEQVIKTKETVPELTEKISFDVVDELKEALPKPSEKSNLEMVANAEKMVSEPTDDLSLEMTIGTKTNTESDDADEISDNADLIEQMKK